MTIKQPKGSGMCAVCVVAMATNTTPEQVYEFLNDGREHGDPIHDPEMAMYLLRHGWVMGRGWNFAEDDGPDRRVSRAEDIHLVLEGIAGERAYLAVKSRNYPGYGHAVYWDGHNVLDPDPGMPDKSDISEYALLQIFPFLWVGTTFTNRLTCEPGPLPYFVKQWRDRVAARIASENPLSVP